MSENQPVGSSSELQPLVRLLHELNPSRLESLRAQHPDIALTPGVHLGEQGESKASMPDKQFAAYLDTASAALEEAVNGLERSIRRYQQKAVRGRIAVGVSQYIAAFASGATIISLVTSINDGVVLAGVAVIVNVALIINGHTGSGARSMEPRLHDLARRSDVCFAQLGLAQSQTKQRLMSSVEKQIRQLVPEIYDALRDAGEMKELEKIRRKTRAQQRGQEG